MSQRNQQFGHNFNHEIGCIESGNFSMTGNTQEFGDERISSLQQNEAEFEQEFDTISQSQHLIRELKNRIRNLKVISSSFREIHLQ